jgi:hypothetical protein
MNGACMSPPGAAHREEDGQREEEREHENAGPTMLVMPAYLCRTTAW